MPILLVFGALCSSALPLQADTTGREFHVSVAGDDVNVGSVSHRLRTISEAARRAQPGDVITVGEGVYRERIDPPRGGLSNQQRIVYRAVPGETVVLKGSERVQGWKKVQNQTWKLVLPDSYFGDFNPFKDEIRGDWYRRKDRTLHTGAVYLDGHWLTEAASLDDVMEPAGESPLWFTLSPPAQEYLMNVAWFRPQSSERVKGVGYASQRGVQAAVCTEGGECIGWINGGDWLDYKTVDFGNGANEIEFRVSSATDGGVIEIRRDSVDGEVIGRCSVGGTGGWQQWESVRAEIQPTRGVQNLCLVFRAGPTEWEERNTTTIWAQFPEVDPNQEEVEINVRQSVFYPSKPGINFITVRGFTMHHAATNWAPPTAEQIGLIGTHWSQGWIIEDNDVGYSTCTGITLGKHGDRWDNTSANSAEGYVETINRGLARGWSREKIGSHIVRNNTVAYCEQAGIVGSLGAAFSTVEDNTFHDIHVRRLFTGAEMAAIKFHGALDGEISRNHIYRCNRGIWLDWMTQGTRVSRNLLHDNGPSEDLFLEVNHGPVLVDHNLFLSPQSLLINSQGAGFAHNLIAGKVRVITGESRLTPANKPHATQLDGLHPNLSGDDRYFHNLFVGGGGLKPYDRVKLPVQMAGNVFLNGAQPSNHESKPLIVEGFDSGLQVKQKGQEWLLELRLNPAWRQARPRLLLGSERFGHTAATGLPFELPSGGSFQLKLDFHQLPRGSGAAFPGPFEEISEGLHSWRVWPHGPIKED
jgi:alpha-L-arabinofuranosidase